MCYKLNYILCPLEPVFLSPLMFPIGFNGLLNLQSCRLKISDQIRSVAQSCLTLCDPMNLSMPGLPVHHQLPEFTQTHVCRVGDAIHALSPLLLLPSSFASIRVFSNESVFRIRWPKYWSFSFNISPSSDCSLISFRN